eukprot:TRINITY_DN17030_c0_g2_i1.p1 TRINITY_DN17030_c0_g2~~TRINITY_DN17030_c0_g2_i1.p1  ORF type:complete len:568 (+),score=80.56 TRINITY_DN17030_c0_g2_i1:67-1770(+)
MEKYSFVQRLGQGSFAVVWKARRKSDGRLVALKQLKQSPESWEACKALPEVRAAASISDRRHLVQLLEAVRHGGELFLVFEFIEGNLHHCIAAARRMDESQVRWTGRQLLIALAAVHAAGLVHCDVKPENILVGAEGGSCGAPTVKLCDFGQAAPPGEIGTYIGTRWYRPPELFLGSRGDASVDLWSAGCTIAELFLRRPLVPGSDSRDMLFRICGEIGAPDETYFWPLAAQFVEVTGRPNAQPAAWDSLRAAGASQNCIHTLSGLLQYDGARRTRAEGALRSPFFSPEFPQAPVAVPAARPLSPESLRRSREEAQAVERRLHAKGGSQSPAPPLPPGASPLKASPSSPRLMGAGQQALGGFGGGLGLGLAPAACGGGSSSSSCLHRNGAQAATRPPPGNAGGLVSGSPPRPSRGVADGRSMSPASSPAAHGAEVPRLDPFRQDASDDEALAEAFGSFCKTGDRGAFAGEDPPPPPAPQPPEPAEAGAAYIRAPSGASRTSLGGQSRSKRPMATAGSLTRAPRLNDESPSLTSLIHSADQAELQEEGEGLDDEDLAERFWTEVKAPT